MTNSTGAGSGRPLAAWVFGLSLALLGATVAGAFGRKPWNAPSYAARKRNPVKPDAQSIERGRKLFEQNCAACHGKGAKGDGPAGRYLRPPAADLTSDRVRRQTDGELFWKIQHGRSPMPSFRNALSETDIWNVINFLRQLAPPIRAHESHEGADSARGSDRKGE